MLCAVLSFVTPCLIGRLSDMARQGLTDWWKTDSRKCMFKIKTLVTQSVNVAVPDVKVRIGRGSEARPENNVCWLAPSNIFI